MKLCFVASGISLHAAKWADWFAKEGHQVHLITPPYNEPMTAFRRNVRLHTLKSVLPVNWRGSRLWNILPWANQTATLLTQVQPDLVEGQFVGMTGYTAWIACALLKYSPPFVLQPWGSDILIEAKKQPYKFFTKMALAKADMILCDSDTVQAGVQGLGIDMSKVKRMCNGVDTQFFIPPDKNTQRKKIIISTRSLETVYDVETTIRAFKIVLEHFPEMELILAGRGKSGSIGEKLQELVTKLSLRDKVTFTGWLSTNKIRDWLQIAQVYVSTSLSDSTSLSLQEAMSCEMPVVVSDIPANREWVEHGTNGYLCETGNAQAVANSIKSLLRNPEQAREFGKLNRDIIIKEADYNDNMRMVEGYYKELIG